MAEGYVFKISGNIAQYASEVAKIPGVTDKAAAQAALKMGQQFAKMQADAAKKAKGAAKESGDAWTQTSAVLKNSAKVSGFGELAEKAGAASAAIEGILTPAGALVGAVGAIGIAAGSSALAFGALTVALVDSAFAAEKNLKALEGFRAIGSDFYPSIPPETLASFKALAATEDALASIGERLSLSAASSVAPSLERVADVVVGLALQSERLFEKWADGKNLFEELATQVLTGFAQALTLPMAPLVALGDGVGLLAKVAGVDLPEGMRLAIADLDRLRDGQWARSVAETTVAAVENSGAMRALSGAVAGAEQEGRAFIATQERATAAQKDAAKATKEHADAQRKAAQAYAADLSEEMKAQQEFASGIAALQAASKKATDEQLSGLAAVLQARKDDLAALQATYQATLAQAGTDQQRLAAVQAFEAAKTQTILSWEQKLTEAKAEEDRKRATSEKAALDQQQSMLSTYVGAASGLFGTLGDVASVAMEGIDPKKHKEAFMAAFAAQKGAAAAQAGLNTFLAISNALALPLPPPLPEAAAVAAGALGIAQEAKILSAPPPKFHQGTFSASAVPTRADEFQATLQRGEIVVPKPVATSPGFKPALAAAVSGATSRGAHPDDVAEGMDRSSVPGLLQALLDEFRRNRGPSFPTTGRPGHRPSYGY